MNKLSRSLIYLNLECPAILTFAYVVDKSINDLTKSFNRYNSYFY